MNIAVVGAGYVGLVTGTCLADIGHNVICIDNDERKVNEMKQGVCPIYEPGLQELMSKNMNSGRLKFDSGYKKGIAVSDLIILAVGTPQKADGSADLTYIENAAVSIAKNINGNKVIITKSTVPVGTNKYIKKKIESNLTADCIVDIISNPEFLREGHAVYDTFHGDRIVIGYENESAADIVRRMYEPLGIPIFMTGIESAEIIKYASNAFLATKISFINEIANICEKVGADVEDVSKAMGMDRRIGSHFLKAGIGYGGSCFPKDTNALVSISGSVEHEFDLLKAVIRVNNEQRKLLVNKARIRFGSLNGKAIALLGLSFKPGTDDMREAASIVIAEMLVEEGAVVKAYDPVAAANARKTLPQEVVFADSIDDAVRDADAVFIMTEWDEIRNVDIGKAVSLMKEPVIFDGRNCFSLDEMLLHGVEYYSVGRPAVINKIINASAESMEESCSK